MECPSTKPSIYELEHSSRVLRPLCALVVSYVCFIALFFPSLVKHISDILDSVLNKLKLLLLLLYQWLQWHSEICTQPQTCYIISWCGYISISSHYLIKGKQYFDILPDSVLTMVPWLPRLAGKCLHQARRHPGMKRGALRGMSLIFVFHFICWFCNVRLTIRTMRELKKKWCEVSRTKICWRLK